MMAEPTPAARAHTPLTACVAATPAVATPLDNACDLDYLPDEDGLTRWGCTVGSPGQGAPHLATCAVGIGSTPRPERRGIVALGGAAVAFEFLGRH